MTTEIGVPAEMADDLGRFLSDASIDLAIVGDGSAAIRIVPPGPERLESDLETLYAGGWISCERARALAKRLDIKPGDVGRLLDRLDVKIRQCVLGCFE